MKEDEKQPSKKRLIFFSNYMSSFFVAKEPFKKEDMQQKQILKDLTLLIIKNHLPLQFVKSNWLKRFNMQLCPIKKFHSKKYFLNELLLELVEKLNNYMFY